MIIANITETFGMFFVIMIIAGIMLFVLWVMALLAVLTIRDKIIELKKINETQVLLLNEISEKIREVDNKNE